MCLCVYIYINNQYNTNNSLCLLYIHNDSVDVFKKQFNVRLKDRKTCDFQIRVISFEPKRKGRKKGKQNVAMDNEAKFVCYFCLPLDTTFENLPFNGQQKDSFKVLPKKKKKGFF